jgi:hypothetical protein
MTLLLKTLLAAGLAAATAAAQPQSKLSGPVQIEAKRAELALIQEQLADPDPLKRQAAILTIVESGDAMKIDFALRIALASDDASVRAIALRAYMANLKELDFDIQSPPEIQRQLDAALNSDPDRMQDLFKRYPYLGYLSQNFHFRLHLRFKDYSMSRSTGVVTGGGNYPETFTVSGDRVSANGSLLWNGPCTFEFQPQSLVRNSPPVLKGTLMCSQRDNYTIFPRMTITAPLF